MQKQSHCIPPIRCPTKASSSLRIHRSERLCRRRHGRMRTSGPLLACLGVRLLIVRIYVWRCLLGGRISCNRVNQAQVSDNELPYKHFSSMTLITGRMPLCILGAGTPASEPSPRKRVWSSFLVTWAASRIVKGRTRTVTEMEDAPAAAMIAPWICDAVG